MMKWMRLFVGFTRDDAVSSLTRSEQLLYIELILWSVEHNTNGRIPASALKHVGVGHKGKLPSVQKMVALGLLAACAHDRDGLAPYIGMTWEIRNFPKWQATQPARTPKVAGQAPASDTPRTHTHTSVRRTDQNGLYIEDVSTLAPAIELTDSRLAALVDRIGKKVNGSG